MVRRKGTMPKNRAKTKPRQRKSAGTVNQRIIDSNRHRDQRMGRGYYAD